MIVIGVLFCLNKRVQGSSVGGKIDENTSRLDFIDDKSLRVVYTLLKILMLGFGLMLKLFMQM